MALPMACARYIVCQGYMFPGQRCSSLMLIAKRFTSAYIADMDRTFIKLSISDIMRPITQSTKFTMNYNV